jgi:hypothetical protein
VRSGSVPIINSLSEKSETPGDGKASHPYRSGISAGARKTPIRISRPRFAGEEN